MPDVDLPVEYVTHLNRQGFDLGQVLGQGLSGSVYAADQPSLGRKVAVKFFDSAFVRGDADMRKRFSREARILAKFQHQGVPYVLTRGSVQAAHGDAPYFVMEYVEGKTLRQILNNGKPIGLRTSISYAQQVLDALGYAHARDIVHRDVKPGNIMVDQRGRCFLIDFSIGVSLRPESGLTRATGSADQLGTTAYMSPEQFRDPSTIDGRADVFAMGVVLLEMLTGHSDRTNIPKALREFPHSIIACIETACAMQLEERYQSAEDFVRALGGAEQILAPATHPALAICVNPKCAGADWSSRGYYRSPKVMEDSRDSYCTNCGEHLRYRCKACGAPIVNAPHCGNCGEQIYSIPTCEKCGSWLTLEYMGADTSNGCSKCSGRRMPEEVPAKDEFDDDIPF